MVFLKHLHIIKMHYKLLKYNILVIIIFIVSIANTPLFSQSDSTIKRNFSDSITNSCQIVINIPTHERNILNHYFKKQKNSLTYSEFQKIGSQILTFLENDGYPFASVYLDSIKSIYDTVFFSMVIDRSKLILYDSIEVKGDLRLSQKFLKTYLNFKKGELYQEGNIQKIPKLIDELPFVTIRQPLGVDFIDDRAHLILFLDKRKVNQFDGIIGFAPINQTTGKIGFTGELKLLLQNTFQIGESVSLHWKAPEATSQLLDINTIFSYILNTPLGFDAQFHLDKKDTSYLKLNSVFSINYSFGGNNFIKTFVDYTYSNIINTQYTEQSNLFGNFTKTMYGLAFQYKNLDFINNPRKGFQVYLQGSVGKRETQNGSDNAIRYAAIVDGKGFIPLYKNWIFVLGLKSGMMTGTHFYKNELYRLGGMNTLQGFDELSIYANNYSFGILELRYKLSRMSYVNGFFNGGWYKQNLLTTHFSDFVYGFGLGFAFETRAGIFNLSYALGSQQGNPVSFNTGKVHFGIAVQF